MIKTNNSLYKNLLTNLFAIARETNDPILLMGKPGVGKTRIAKMIHKQWEKKQSKTNSPFKELNCATLNNSQLILSELFGHKKGAFTGAITDHDGLIKSANNGTLFLDEIGDLDLYSQAKLLKTLEHGEYLPLGSNQIEKSNFRLICATNKKLEQEIANNNFREDLYSRLRNWVFRLPSLKELPEDIELYINEKLDEWNKTEKKSVVFAKNAFDIFLNFALSDEATWTANFRDVKRSINRMAWLASIKDLGGTNKITKKIVELEIKNLKDIWNRTFENELSDDYSYNQLKHIALRKNLPLAYIAEQYLIDAAIADCKGKKAAAKLLYGDCLSNPSSKINDRIKFLRKKFNQNINL